MIELSHAGDGLLRQSFAGDVVNTLWYARKALDPSWDVSFYSGVGTDQKSDEMLTFLESAGIGCAEVLRVPDRMPGLYMIHLDGAERSFSYWRDTSAARTLGADRARLSQVIDASDMIYISGITLAILPADDAAFLIESLLAAKSVGKQVAFDPNIRPKLWENPEGMRDTIMRAAAASTIVLPSFDDEAAAFGDATVDDTIARYSGADLVVTKNGADDVCVSMSDGVRRIDTPIVSAPVDTTGAGDSFNGGFLASFVKAGDVDMAVAAGQACAGRVIQQYGALI